MDIVDVDDSSCLMQKLHLDFNFYLLDIKSIHPIDKVVSKKMCNAYLSSLFGVILKGKIEEKWPNLNELKTSKSKMCDLIQGQLRGSHH